MKIDLHNYESVFFNLLEGNYSKEEEEAILEQIDGDTFLRFEWESWEKLRLTDESDDYADKFGTFFDGIREEADAVVAPKVVKTKRRTWVPLMIGVAASLMLLLWFIPTSNYHGVEVVDVGVEQKKTLVPESEEVDETADKKVMELVSQEEERLKDKEDVDQGVTAKLKRSAPMVNGLPIEQASEQGVTEVAVLEPTMVTELDELVVDSMLMANMQDRETPTRAVDDALEIKPKYERKFIVTTEDIKKRDVVLTQKEIEGTSLRKLLEDKTIRLVSLGDKTYLRLESQDDETVLIGLQQ